MKRIKLITLTIILLLAFKTNVKADNLLCSESDIARAKAEADKINVNYQLIENTKGLYNVTITGLIDTFYIKNGQTDEYYKKVDNVIKISGVEGGKQSYKVVYHPCDNKVIKTITIKIPKYNEYADNEICKGVSIDKIVECDEWYQGTINESKVKEKVAKYNEENTNDVNHKENDNIIINFLLNYYIYIIAIIIIIVIATLIIIKRKKASILE